MSNFETGENYFTTNGNIVKLLQKNERTYLVSPTNDPKRTFHVLHEELFMHPAGNALPKEAVTSNLRKPQVARSVLVEVKHIPEHYDIRINGLSIDKYSDDELFSWIQDIEAEMAELEKITNRPLVLAKLLDDKRRAILDIVAWMNGNRK